MRISLEQYPGLVQNISTLGLVDLTDNDPEVLARLIVLLETALANASRALQAIGDAEEERDFRIAEQDEDPIVWPRPPGDPPF